MEKLAEKLGLTRHTIAKYLEVLRAEGKHLGPIIQDFFLDLSMFNYNISL